MRGHLKRGGHTLVELIVALSIFALVAASTQSLLRRAMARYHERETGMQAEQSSRIGIAALTLELQDLDASDRNGGDLLEVTGSSVTYRSMMNMYFVCRPPDLGMGRVIVRSSPWVGTQALDGNADLALIMASGDSAQDRWLSYMIRGVETGKDCPGGEGSLSLLLDALNFAALAAVPVGAPVRGYRVTRIQSYRDGDGVWWAGLQTRGPIGAWAATQPFAGPLAPGGLTFTYRDGSGGLVVEPGSVARIGIQLVSAPDRGKSGSVIETEVWLHNNPRTGL